MRNKVKAILSRPTQEIIISILIISFGLFVIFNNHMDKILKIVIGLTTIASGVYYLIIEDWKSPIFFSLTVVASGVFTVLFLDNTSADLVGYTLSTQMFLYFASLSINYISEVKGNKKFVLSGIISITVVLFTKIIKSDSINFYALLFSAGILACQFCSLLVLRRKESHEQLHSDKN